MQLVRLMGKTQIVVPDDVRKVTLHCNIYIGIL